MPKPRVNRIDEEYGSMVVTGMLVNERNRTDYVLLCICGNTVTREGLTGAKYCSQTCSQRTRQGNGRTKARTVRMCRVCLKSLPITRYFHHAKCVEGIVDELDEIYNTGRAA